MSRLQKNINSILIANRGEIASRVIRTCRKMGIRSIAVYSDADRNMPYVQAADVAVYIGPSPSQASYLNQEVIIQMAKDTGADAIHPGYGFLSEQAEFAERCEGEGIIFIGPNPGAIRAMGSKAEAKRLMQEHGVPIKASAGGGGKGMRIVHAAEELESAIESAKSESQSSFGDARIILEKYVSAGRHIEFQIFGDHHGQVIHLLERECTIQRRYQKIIEESPSPVMTDDLRSEMGVSAVKAAKAISYDNAGTVEFIYDDKTGDYYFLEVNTRLQVEHPVTEEITGLDLVQMQIESAQGMPLKISQEEVTQDGYAIEVRLYAEDPDDDFRPAPGKILKFDYPAIDDLRVESAVADGTDISIYYDPMIAKLIVHDQDRVGAIKKMDYVLSQMICLGITTNQSYLRRIVQQDNFIKGRYTTDFIEKYSEALSSTSLSSQGHHAAMVATIYGWIERQNQRTFLKSLPSGWRSNFYAPQTVSYKVHDTTVNVSYTYHTDEKEGYFNCKIDEEEYKVAILTFDAPIISLEINGKIIKTTILKRANEYYLHNSQIGGYLLSELDRYPDIDGDDGQGGYTSKMPGQIVKVEVSAGDKVQEGDLLLTINSMKMETGILAHASGVVTDVFVEAGQNVEADSQLIEIKSE